MDGCWVPKTGPSSFLSLSLFLKTPVRLIVSTMIFWPALSLSFLPFLLSTWSTSLLPYFSGRTVQWNSDNRDRSGDGFHVGSKLENLPG